MLCEVFLMASGQFGLALPRKSHVRWLMHGDLQICTTDLQLNVE